MLKVYYSDTFAFPLPESHRFPLSKYLRLRERLLLDPISTSIELLLPPAASDEQLAMAHDPGYIEKVRCGTLTEKELRRIGLPWSPELVERARRSVGGTLAACEKALDAGVAFNLAGGTHHAHSDSGAGFCLFNDCAVAARNLQATAGVGQVMILDLDVHQGDGTAEIFANDPSVFTLSAHAAKNYPFHKQPGDLDLELPDGLSDLDYQAAVFPVVADCLARVRPELVIYIAGADPYRSDSLGRMALSKTGLARRDQFVLEQCWEAGVPVGVVLGGGYARDIEDSIEIHLETLRIAVNFLS